MSEKVKIKDDFITLYRSLEFSQRFLGKHYLLADTVQMILRTCSPYISVYCSGMVVTALSQGKPFDDMLRYVLVACFTVLICDLIMRFINRYRLNMLNFCYEKHNALLAQKALSLDYAKAESSAVKTLRGKVEDIAGTGRGIAWVCDCVAEIVSCSVSVVIAVVMAGKMVFDKSTENLTGILKLSNSPVLAVLFILMAVAGVFISAKCQSNGEKKYFKVKNSLHSFVFQDYYNKKYLNETDSGKDVRIYNEENLIREELNKNVYFPNEKNFYKRLKIFLTDLSITGLISNMLGSLVYIFVGLKSMSGAFGVGKVVEYYGVITKLINSCSDIAGNFGYLRANMISLRQELQYLDLEPDMKNGTRAVSEVDTDNLVFEFHNVSFKYPETEKYVLENINLTVYKGECLAFVGRNGSGKSTAIKLLCRLYDPTEGYITVNGTDIKEFDSKEYLKLLAVVFQDYSLLAFPIGEVVACSEKYDEKAVWQALDDAGMKQRTESFSDKLNTAVYKLYDKNGIDLSGGEAQKTAIARALYRDAPFMILDEPTAALDPIAESEIYERLGKISGDKTSVFVSHRLSSCRFCSRIIVFDKGEIIQQGTHEELLAQPDGKYYQLWNAQAQYYTDNAVS